jgi:CheY-like chemotaxis protein
MTRVAAFIPDLLFGSRVQGALGAAGYEVELISSEGRVRELLTDGETAAPEVLVVDLTDAELGGAELVAALAAEGLLGGTRTLGFYSHVDAPARERAEQAGFDLVVARSRMAREGAQLVARLDSGQAPA